MKTIPQENNFSSETGSALVKGALALGLVAVAGMALFAFGTESYNQAFTCNIEVPFKGLHDFMNQANVLQNISNFVFNNTLFLYKHSNWQMYCLQSQ